MIRSFANTNTQTDRIWNGLRSKRLPPDVQKRALIKLLMLDASTSLEDLRFPPSNGLHDLNDDRLDQHAISINKKYRICFVWKDGDAYDVEIVDYH
jgi:toxin HigB-1